MTSAEHTRTGRSPAARRSVVALRETREAWALLVLAGGETPAVVETKSGAGSSGLEQAQEAAARHKASRLVRIVPSAQTIVKGVLVPDAAPEETLAALSLQSEAMLPASLADFRRAAGRVPDSGRAAGRLALLTGWRSPVPPGQENHKKGGIRTTHIAEASALAFLRGPGEGVALSADPGSGSITLIAAGPERTLVRSLVENAESRDRFHEAAAAVAREAAQHVGAPGLAMPGVTRDAFVCLTPDASARLASRASGASDEKGWINRFGLALGAAMAALSDDPASAVLADLSERAPQRDGGLVARGSEWLAVRRHWAAVIAASLAVLLLGPWILAKARMLVLESKSSGLRDRTSELELADRREAMYSQLELSRWPMTKLLADVSRSAPVGITVESLSLSPDQGLAIQGTANSPETMNQFIANLNATRVFTGTRINRQETGASVVDFQLSAGVASPHSKSAAGEDFAAKPLAVRLYGEGASNTTAPVTSGGGSPEPRRSERTSSRTSGGRSDPERSSSNGSSGSSGSSSGSSGSSSASSAGAGPVPPPLTDEQISSMSRAAAMTEFVKRRTYPQKNPAIDAGTKARLEDEVRRLQEQMQKASQPASGGGSS